MPVPYHGKYPIECFREPFHEVKLLVREVESEEEAGEKPAAKSTC